MVDPLSVACVVGATNAAVWAADLVWDLAKGAVGNELHLQLRRSLPGAYSRFTRDNLPPNHDLEKAVRAALERALLSFATGLQATTDRSPSAFAKARAYLLRGPEFESQARLEQREQESAWLQAFRALVSSEQRLQELEVITTETARTLLATDVSEPARELLHSSVQQWATRHMTDVQGWPVEWHRCLHEGWDTRSEGDDRITLSQAWALHFREAIKQKQDVFNIFVAGELAEGIPATVCSRIDGVLRGHLDGVHNALKAQLDRMESKVDWIAEQTGRVHEKVSEIGAELAHIKENIQAIASPLRGTRFGELPAPPEHFMGRDSELAELVARLLRPEPGGHVITAGVMGMGGVGKTALALAVGHAARAHYSGGTLFFRLGAHSGEPVPGRQALRRWLEVRAALTKTPAPQPGDDLNRRFLQELAHALGPVLVVVDDPGSEADIRPLRPRSGDGLLVTARKPLAGLQALPLPALAPADAVALLRRLSNRALSDSEAQALAARCAHLPTALQALGGLLARRPNKPVSELLAELAAARLSTLTKAAKGDAEHDVYAVLHYSVQALSETERAALQALCVMPGDFNRTLGTAVVGDDADLLDALGEAGVLDVLGATGRYRLHDLMREVVHINADQGLLDAACLLHARAVYHWLEACDRAYDSVEPNAPASALASFGAERAHLGTALAWLKHKASHTELFSSLVLSLSGVASKLMHPRELLPWHASAAAAARVLEHRQSEAAQLCIQADLCAELGEVAAAGEFARQALELCRTLAGELDTIEARQGVSASLDRVGRAALAQGDFVLAEALFRESLELRRMLAREQNTPQARRDVSTSLELVGEVALAQGEWAQAEAPYRKSLALLRTLARERNTPRARRDVSVLLEKVGQVAQALGDSVQAESLLRESLELRRMLARELSTPQARRDVSVSLNRVGRVAQARGDLAEAEALFRDSLEVNRTLARELNTPPARRDVSVSLMKLGQVTQAQGNLAQAEALFREGLEVSRMLAREHNMPEVRRDVSVLLQRVGEVAQAHGDLAQAEALFRDSLEVSHTLVRELNTPKARGDLSVSLIKVGEVVQAKGDLAEAEALFRESLEVSHRLACELNTPAARRGVCVSLIKLGQVAQAQGDSVQAEALFRESLEVSRTLLRELNAPEARRDVGVSLWKLADLTRQHGDVNQSCALLREAESVFCSLAELLKTPQAEQELQAVRAQLARDGYND